MLSTAVATVVFMPLAVPLMVKGLTVSRLGSACPDSQGPIRELELAP
jgi:hypothetical protein